MSPPSKSSSALSITLTQASKVRLVSSFLSLFVLLALFHAAEIAITTLYPWKVREFAEEEGGMWLSLDADITRVLTTILVSSTTAGIYATTVFGKLAAASGPTLERYAAPALTLLTLFFVELLPKSIGVSNAEMVARKLVPPINFLAHIVSPVGVCLTGLAKRVLRIFGFSVGGMELVTEEELRLIVSGARDSGSIESTEGDMIQAVLDLQDQKVEEIMKPRVEIVAVEGSMSVANVLGVIRESGYSRIPVYEGEIDNVVGVVLAKDLIDFFVGGLQVRDDRLEKIKNDKAAYDNVKEEDGDVDGDDTVAIPSTNIDQPTTAVPDPRTGPTSSYHSELSNASPGGSQPTPTPAFGFGGGYGAASVEVVERALTGAEVASRMSTGIEDAGLVQDVYFVPESMLVWNVLQEMKKRRVHLAIVVDEYGGTEGLVSLEDIIEEVVGEIYDEDDEEEVMRIAEEGGMVRREDGKYNVRGGEQKD
jgi:CBS domain containing-hemolysin-like protein